MRRNSVLLDESILFVFQLDGDIVFFRNFVALLSKACPLELLNYFSSLGFLIFYLLYNLCLVALLAKIGKFAHSLV